MGATDTGAVTTDDASPARSKTSVRAGCSDDVTFFIAREMEIPVTGTTLGLEGGLDLAGVTGASPDVRPGEQGLRAVIDGATTAAAEDVERLRAAVEVRCPLSDHVTRATPVEIAVRPAG